jgi:hypothetical protein
MRSMTTETNETVLQYRMLQDVEAVAEFYGICVNEVTVQHMNEFNHIDTTAATGAW